MALIKESIELNSGLVVEDVYARIDTLGGDKTSQTFSLFYFISKSASDSGKEPVKRESYTFPVSVDEGSVNFIEQGYKYLKSLPEFANVVDA